MKYSNTDIYGGIVFDPKLFYDERGFFYESWNFNFFRKVVGDNFNFVQDNHSYSKKDVLRGLHYQINNPQGKLIRVINGTILDVIVDLRKSSPTFSKTFSIILTSENKKILWAPPGCAHGFRVLSKSAEVFYKVTSSYSPNDERCIKWNDKDLNIDWISKSNPIISKKDELGLYFKDAEYFS